ncbi:hypothetical protein J6590_017541 [Homalodisca vitripennis]|nr:hypothetical protein J6590_017541 [Homalodisca vitripennis]
MRCGAATANGFYSLILVYLTFSASYRWRESVLISGPTRITILPEAADRCRVSYVDTPTLQTEWINRGHYVRRIEHYLPVTATRVVHYARVMCFFTISHWCRQRFSLHLSTAIEGGAGFSAEECEKIEARRSGNGVIKRRDEEDKWQTGSVHVETQTTSKVRVERITSRRREQLEARSAYSDPVSDAALQSWYLWRNIFRAVLRHFSFGRRGPRYGGSGERALASRQPAALGQILYNTVE